MEYNQVRVGAVNVPRDFNCEVCDFCKNGHCLLFDSLQDCKKAKLKDRRFNVGDIVYTNEDFCGASLKVVDGKREKESTKYLMETYWLDFDGAAEKVIDHIKICLENYDDCIIEVLDLETDKKIATITEKEVRYEN